MPKVVREGDVNTAGGRAVSGLASFIVDGRKVVPIGTPVTPHKPCPEKKKHCNAKTSEGTNSFIVGGRKINVVGHKDTCGHARATGSSSMIVES
jgi:uncharacterized Zn-binding protein involved in type VI secretion